MIRFYPSLLTVLMLFSISSGAGQVTTTQARAHIGREYAAFVGEDVTVPIVLDDNLDSMEITELRVNIDFDPVMFLVSRLQERISSTLEGGLLEGWEVTILRLENTGLTALFTAPKGTVLRGTGSLLNLTFRLPRVEDCNECSEGYLQGDTLETDIRFTIVAVDRPQVEFITSSGHVVLERLNYLVLHPATPNVVVNDRFSIQFDLRESGAVSMELYASDGELIDRPLNDATFTFGRHTLEIATTGLAPGEYFVVARTGALRMMQRVLVLK